MTYNASPLVHGARSPHNRCVVRGCAEQPDRDALICRRHAQDLRPVPPAEFSHPDDEGATA